MGVVWIASYPKSGNTWVRFLLANYLLGPVDASAKVAQFIPDVTQPGVDLGPPLAERPVVYAKTHYPWSAQHPAAAQTQGAVIVLRNLKDVVLSNLNYHRLVQGSEKEFSDREYLMSFIAQGGDARWSMSGYGTLEQHTLSWLDAPESLRRIIVRYEDLKADTARELTRILEFLGEAADPERVKAAAANSSFDKLRALEVREKASRKTSAIFPGAAPRPGKARYFINRGQVGQTLAGIDPGLDRAFDERFAALIGRLGYDKAG